jgi:polynucleotide 5'-kinase involved in rRNA processing
MKNKTGFGHAQKTSHSNELVSFPEASGTSLSITNWARLAKLDKNQRRAFEVFASSFVLTFFRDADQSTVIEGLRNVNYLLEKLRLNKLAGRIHSNATRQKIDSENSENLVCFLHGPGGSGKSAVLELLLIYAAEYCHHVGEIYTETTIVVTALSGVAATLVKGRAVH